MKFIKNFTLSNGKTVVTESDKVIRNITLANGATYTRDVDLADNLTVSTPQISYNKASVLFPSEDKPLMLYSTGQVSGAYGNFTVSMSGKASDYITVPSGGNITSTIKLQGAGNTQLNVSVDVWGATGNYTGNLPITVTSTVGENRGVKDGQVIDSYSSSVDISVPVNVRVRLQQATGTTHAYLGTARTVSTMESPTWFDVIADSPSVDPAGVSTTLNSSVLNSWIHNLFQDYEQLPEGDTPHAVFVLDRYNDYSGLTSFVSSLKTTTTDVTPGFNIIITDCSESMKLSVQTNINSLVNGRIRSIICIDTLPCTDSIQFLLGTASGLFTEFNNSFSTFSRAQFLNTLLGHAGSLGFNALADGLPSYRRACYFISNQSIDTLPGLSTTPNNVAPSYNQIVIDSNAISRYTQGRRVGPDGNIGTGNHGSYSFFQGPVASWGGQVPTNAQFPIILQVGDYDVGSSNFPSGTILVDCNGSQWFQQYATQGGSYSNNTLCVISNPFVADFMEAFITQCKSSSFKQSDLALAVYGVGETITTNGKVVSGVTRHYINDQQYIWVEGSYTSTRTPCIASICPYVVKTNTQNIVPYFAHQDHAGAYAQWLYSS